MIIRHVFIFNSVEFTQGKFRIARDATVNDYLCCNSVKCLGPSFKANDVPPHILRWMGTQQVKIGKTVSSVGYPKCGVPRALYQALETL